MSLIDDLTEEFENGRIYEATIITDDGWHLWGLYDPDKGSVTIDPRVPIVSTLLHELIHRRYPEWSEKKVRRAENRAMRQLSPEAVRAWYRRYRRAVRKRRPVDGSDYKG